MKRQKIKQVLSDEEVTAHFMGRNLFTSDKPVIVTEVIRESAVFYKPDGSLLAVLLKECIDERLLDATYQLLRTVNQEPSNRPEIIGKGSRQPRIRKSDGKLSRRIGVAASVRAVHQGKADFLGHYRYKNSAPGEPDCKMTGWTRRRTDVYLGALPFLYAVEEVYRTFLPRRYAAQKNYVDQIPEGHKIPGSVFTTWYVLKNCPTAVHIDKMDIPAGFGVMATLGCFQGGEFCFPKYKIAFDYQPGDVLFADVHEAHGNFPVIGGERVASVFFVRKGMHECGR